MLDDILKHLDALVAFDTRNPPRAIGTGGIFDYLRAQLSGFEVEIVDHGVGAVSLYARRGVADTVFNVHLDTVPDAPGWSSPPHALRIADGRACGLGACDIKGAAACLLAVAARTRGPMALLFTSDEEANDARCINAFLAREHGHRHALVAEPTRAQAVLAHRGIGSAQIAFAGIAGHGSEARALTDSAIHRAVRWASLALVVAEHERTHRFEELEGLRLNLGRIEGGIKGNIIAPSAEIRFGFRPLPGEPIEAWFERFAALVPADEIAGFDRLFVGPALPAHDAAAALAASRALAERFALPIGPAVDFWTEASLFSAAGLHALVFGPGDIAQAHTVDEWVALDQLHDYARHCLRIVDDAAA